MARLYLLTDKTVQTLQGLVPSNMEKYRQDTEWLSAEFAGHDYLLESKLSYPDEFSLMKPEDNKNHDTENAIRIFEALPDLNPVQAADPRVWTYLTHVTCWNYMRQRWRVTEGRDPNWVLEHYFVRSASSRALIRNGLARLWWYSFLTIDPARDDKFALTRVLLSQLDIAQSLLERSLGRNKNLLHGTLSYIETHPDMMESGNAGRERIRSLVRHLHRVGGYSLLECLSTQEVTDILQKFEEQQQGLVVAKFVED